MSLGADVLAAMPFFRSEAESRMTELVRVGVITPGEFDESTGTYPDALTIHYEGIARVKYPSMVVSEKTPVGQVLASQSVVLSLPVGLGVDVAENDTVWVDASSADPRLAGKSFRVKADPQMGQVTASRFPVESL